jgi:ABC-type multidrug transport system ATPase subunit
MSSAPASEIRESVIAGLLDKVRDQKYRKFLRSVTLKKMKRFAGVTISFDFPVVALIGPNGGGKTTVLATCACIFSHSIRQKAFQSSAVGDEKKVDWEVGYELIDRDITPNAPMSGTLTFDGDHWEDKKADGGKWGNSKEGRALSFLGVARTIPLIEDPAFHLRGRLVSNKKHRKTTFVEEDLDNALSDVIRREGERVLGKSLAEYRFLNVTAATEFTSRQSPDHSLTERFFVGKNEIATFSELNFGAGESSVLRIIADVEAMEDGSLILIDEIENGLHPVAVRRLVEYLIDVARRKSCQIVFTTHSDYALEPLPKEAIWACLEGRVQQGKLSVEVLRAVSGKVDKRLAIFVEDDFASQWLIAALREGASEHVDEIGVYPVGGDANAVKTHQFHSANPAVSFKSLCYLDGDSSQKADAKGGILRLPGKMPERTIFDDVVPVNLDKDLTFLTAACQMSSRRQDELKKAIESVRLTNRDAHLLFGQVAAKFGGLSEAIVKGAFLTVWVQENPVAVNNIVEPILNRLRQ